MKFLKISESTVLWILEQGKHLVTAGLEGVDGDDPIIDAVRPDSAIYPYVAAAIMFIRSIVGIASNTPLIEE